ncbi:hypothetical protein A0H81_07251 [Grifola frondosa]|uniref:WD repeat-containing protein 48 n=1 Tax=Grifola frondosa TaxID=5627 RepID=A0A1C7M932_GRIFR|nr:hypothetical protein A0H81_07251 [Grifola frondosa]
MLNDRMHALTVDTAGEVAVWDVVRCACLGRFMSEDVTAASLCGSDVSVSVAGGSGDGRSVADKDKGRDRERSPREALETVRERIEGQAVVSSWATVDTKTGVLTVHLNEKCFESEIYADEAGYGPERRFGDETRLNIGNLSHCNHCPTLISLMTPLIPINTTIRDSGLSPIPQSPGNSDATPMPRGSQVSDSAAPPDYFNLRNRGGKGSSGQDASGLQTPTTPSAGGLMGRLRAFGKSTKRQANEPGGLVAPGSALPGGESVNPPEDSVTHIVVKTPVQMLLSTPLNPPPSHEAPPLPVPPTTSVIISEEALSGCFVLLPYPSKDPDVEPLPELLNTAQSKLTASRFLRVRKLTNHVQDKIDRITGAHLISNSTTPRSSFDTRSMSPGGKSRDRDHDSRPRAEDMYEVLCNDVVLPLDMTLAAVRQYVWRQAAELTMYYRRKTPNPPR